MAISEADVQASLRTLNDPNTGRDFVSGKSVRKVQIDGNNVAVDLMIAYPARSQHEALRKLVAQQLAGARNQLHHMKRLDVSLVCLFALHLAYVVSREKISKIAVADPLYMCDSNLRHCKSRRAATEYIEEFMVANKHKEIILLPYFPG